MTDAALRAPALLVFVSSLAIVVAAWSIAGMAAVLVGEDVDLEVYVDERIRRSPRGLDADARLRGRSAVFISVVTRNAVDVPLYDDAFVVSMILAVMFLTWYFIDFVQRRVPRADGA